jgi:methyl-accepting chemotaxis protein
MVSKFKLRHIANSNGKLDGISPEVIKILEGMAERKKTVPVVSEQENKQADIVKNKIVLSDNEFGKY